MYKRPTTVCWSRSSYKNYKELFTTNFTHMLKESWMPLSMWEMHLLQNQQHPFAVKQFMECSWEVCCKTCSFVKAHIKKENLSKNSSKTLH